MCRTTVNVSGDLVIAALVSGRQSRRELGAEHAKVVQDAEVVKR